MRQEIKKDEWEVLLGNYQVKPSMLLNEDIIAGDKFHTALALTFNKILVSSDASDAVTVEIQRAILSHQGRERLDGYVGPFTKIFGK